MGVGYPWGFSRPPVKGKRAIRSWGGVGFGKFAVGFLAFP